MKFTKIALTLLCSAILFCGCTKNTGVALKINDKEISRAEFYDDFNRIKNMQLKDTTPELKKNSNYIILSLKERYLNDLITRTLLTQECEKRNIEATKEEIEAKKKQIIAQFGSEEQFKKILKENNITEQRLNSDMESEVRMDKLVKTLTNEKISDAEVEKYYKQNKEQFMMPERIQASHILFDTNAENIKREITDADKTAKLSNSDIEAKVKEELEKKEKLAKEIQQKLAKNPKEFSELAKKYSDDKGSAEKGGDLGIVTRETLVKEFADAAFSQKVGVVGPLVKSPFGYHIILVKDKAASGLQPLSSVKNDLREYLLQQKRVAAMQNLIAGLKSNAKIEYVDESLKPEKIKEELDAAFPKEYKQQDTPKETKETKDLKKINKDKK